MSNVELVTLFGDDLPEVSASRVGTRVAGGVKVSIRDLASTLLAVTVAELLSQDTATLSQQEKKKLFKTSTVLSLTADGAGQGFAGAVANSARGGVPISGLALRMLGKRVTTPDLTIIAMAQSVLAPTGAFVPRQGVKKVSAMAGVSSAFEIDEQVAAGLRDQWPPVRQAWEQWKAANPAMVSPLLDACRKAMSEAKDMSSDSPALD